MMYVTEVSVYHFSHDVHLVRYWMRKFECFISNLNVDNYFFVHGS